MVQIDSVSKPEAVKQQSRQLRGHIARDLRDTATPFDKEGYSLLKFHGIYQGYDRDSATERKQRGDDKVWQFMVRVRIPGGRLTADQYLALDALAGRYADGSLRVTTRQSIQFHGVVKAGLKSAIGDINAALLTTLAACGDVVRTVTTTPAPIRDPVHDRLEAETRRLSNHLLPRTRAYHEIWVDGTPWQENDGASEEPDPLYGERYLPRKFKIGLAIPEEADQRSGDRGAVRGRPAHRLQFPARRRARDDPQQPENLSAARHPGGFCRARGPTRCRFRRRAAASRPRRPRQSPPCTPEICDCRER
jgi:sulfite reductase (ferredoxin)